MVRWESQGKVYQTSLVKGTGQEREKERERERKQNMKEIEQERVFQI